MGYIREPEGVDFFIKSRPLTLQEEKAISEYIQAEKAKRLVRFKHKKLHHSRRIPVSCV